MAIEIGDAIWRIGADDSQLQRTLSGVSTKIGVAMTAAGAAITGTFAKASFDAMSFSKAMANVATLGVRDLGALDKGVREVAANFGLDLNDAAATLYDTISAGIPEDAAIMVMAKAATGAQAGIGSLSEAMDLGTSVLNAWNMKGANANETAANMEKIMGQAATAIKAGKTTIADMAQSVGQVAPIMAAAGVSTEEFFASLAALTATGQPTSSAMSALRAAVSNILKPSESAAKLAASLGLEFNAAALESKGLSVFLQDVQRATGGNVEMLGQLFGSVEGLGAVISLTGNQADAFTATLGEMGNAQMNLNQMSADYIKNNPGFVFEQLKSEMQNLSIVVGRAVLPSLVELFNAIRPLVISFSEWIEANPELTSTLAKVIAAIGGIMTVLGPIIVALPTIVTGFGAVKVAVIAVGSAFAAVAAAIGAPVGIILAAIGAVIAAGVAVVFYWEETKAVLIGIWKAIATAFEGFFAPLFLAWEKLKGMFIDSGFAPALNPAALDRYNNRTALATGGTVEGAGWAVVGERGPELVHLPRGSSVFDAEQSKGMGFNITNHFGPGSVRSDDDIRQIDLNLTRMLETNLRAAGYAF